ncbi:MAG: transcriptional regulator FtrA [Acidobacteriota bacterium]
MHSRVAILAYDRLFTFDYAVAADLFGRWRPGIEEWYELDVCLVDPPPVRGVGGVVIDGRYDLEVLDRADTVVIPGWRDIDDAPPAPLLERLRQVHRRGARLLSICTGSFVLAAAGLLDGRRATTHWAFAEAMAERFPDVEVDPDVLYVDEGRILTSAGSAAGIDLCLYVIRQDLGSQVANLVARRMVVPPHRDGGQSQFIAPSMGAAAENSLSGLLDWLRRHLDRSHTVESMALRAGFTPRTFARRFQEAVGTSPHRWLTRERVLLSQELLETTSASIDRVAERSGFGSAQVLRLHFRRQVGTSPTGYRKTFQCRLSQRRGVALC